MPLETGTYISDLVASNPAHSDGLAQADSHMRLIKSVLKSTFPNVTGAVTATQAALNGLAQGGPDMGSIVPFVLVPPLTVCARGGTFTAPAANVMYIELDGSTYNMADFPALGASFGATFGGNGTTTFAVPRLTDTQRFLRSRSLNGSTGGYQANQNNSHSHTGSTTVTGSCSGSGTTGIENQTWTHNFSWSGTTSGQSIDHTHGYAVFSASNSTAAGPNPPGGGTAGSSTGGTSNDHTHTYSGSGTTGTQNANHNHNFSFSGSISGSGALTINADGGTEARPEAFVCVMTVKT